MSAFLIKNLAICLSGLVVFLIVSEPAFAQNRYFIDDQTVALGGVGVEIPVRVDTDKDRNAMSFALAYDAEKLELVDFDFSGTENEDASWSTGTICQTAGPNCPQAGTVTWSIASGFSASANAPGAFDPDSVFGAGTDKIAGKLIFNVIATGETTTTLEWRDDLDVTNSGFASQNLMVGRSPLNPNDSVTDHVQLTAAKITISGAPSAGNRYVLNDQAVSIGDLGVEVPIRVDTDKDRNAMSFALAYDAEKLELVDFDFSGTENEGASWSTGTICQTAGPSCPQAGTATWSVVSGFSSSPVDPAAFDPDSVFGAGTDKIAGKLIFNVIATGETTTRIEWRDDLDITNSGFESQNLMVGRSPLNPNDVITERVQLTDATITISGAASAGNRYVLNDQTVSVGDTGVEIPIRVDTDKDRHAMSFALSYDAEKLELVDFDFSGTENEGASWSTGTICQTAGPSCPQAGAATWSLVSGFSASPDDPGNFDPDSVFGVGTDKIAGKLIFNVIATGETTTTVEWRDDLDVTNSGFVSQNLMVGRSPSNPNDSITERVLLTSATITISGAPSAGNRYVLQDQIVSVGDTGVEVPIRVDTDKDRHAMSFALSYDADKLELVDFDFSGTENEGARWSTGTICQTAGPDCPRAGTAAWSLVTGFSASPDDPGTFDPDNVFGAGTDKIAGKLIFNVIAAGETTTTVEWRDDLDVTNSGFASQNLMVGRSPSNPADSITERVQLTSATITISGAPSAGNRYVLQDQTFSVGDAGVEVPIRVDTDKDRNAMSFALVYDPEKLELVSFDFSGTENEGARWSTGTICQTVGRDCPRAGTAAWSIVSGFSASPDDPATFDPENVFRAGTDKIAGKLIFNVIATGETTTTVEWRNDLDVTNNGFASQNLMVGRSPANRDDAITEHVQLTSATITIMDSRRVIPIFRRGDCDQSGKADFNDAIFHLKFLFLGENEDKVNSCKDACDSDDSGADDFTDDIHLLKFLFLGQGEIPFPGILADESHPCGADPTEGDTANCVAYSPTIECP